MAIKLVCERITDKALRKLKRYLENYQKVVNKSLQEKSATIDSYWSILFHNELYSACNNPKLINYIEGLRDIERLVQVSKYFKEPELTLFHQQHSKIVQSIAKRDKDEAVKTVKVHLATMRQIYLDYI
jgi:DNA-binding GntR family transcriptional regulator